MIRRYSDLILLPTFEERFEYLKLDGRVGEETFGFDRYLNQDFYTKSAEWKRARDYTIARDLGCDLSMEGYEILKWIIVHHMNPISKEDIIKGRSIIIDPEYLITTSRNTHNAIHYGDAKLLPKLPIERSKYDTCPWRH